jgi:hypothetical protein
MSWIAKEQQAKLLPISKARLNERIWNAVRNNAKHYAGTCQTSAAIWCLRVDVLLSHNSIFITN